MPLLIALDRGWKKEDWEPTLSQALFWASVSDREMYELPKVPGWGPGMRGKVREQLGLAEGQDLEFRQSFVPEKEKEQ